METLLLQDFKNHQLPEFHDFPEAAHDLSVEKGICVSEEGNWKEYDNSKLIPYSNVRSQAKNCISPQDYKARSTGSCKTGRLSNFSFHNFELLPITIFPP